METVLRAATGFLPVGYALLFSLYLSLLVGEESPRMNRLAALWLRLLAVWHLGTLLLRGFVLDHCPLSTGPEILSFLALAIVGTHLVVERITGHWSPVVPVLGLSTVLQTVASAFLTYKVGVSDTLRAWQVPLHAALGICGHAGFFTAAGYALLYIILYRLVKARRIDRLWSQLPPLQTMYRMGWWAAFLGLVFLSLSIGTGLVRAAERGLVPKPLFSSGVIWVAFCGLVVAGRLRRLADRNFAWATLTAVLVDLLLLFTTEVLHRDHFQ